MLVSYLWRMGFFFWSFVVREGELGAVACASFASTWLSSSLTGGYSWHLLPAHGTRQLLVSKQGFELVYNQFLTESEVFLGGFCNECLQFIGESIWPDLMWQRGRSRRLTSWWCWWCPGGVQVVMMSRSRWWWWAGPGGWLQMSSSCYGGGICSGLELWQTRVPQWWQVGSPCQDVAM